jgi:hypothetical protein
MDFGHRRSWHGPTTPLFSNFLSVAGAHVTLVTNQGDVTSNLNSELVAK